MAIKEEQQRADSTATPAFSKKKPGSLGLLAVFVLAGGLGYWYWQSRQGDTQEAEHLLARVEIGSIENTISAAGTLKPSDMVEVGAQVSGQLQKLHVEVGDEVEAGQLLAEIDARVQEERVKASQANLEGQEAQLDQRRSALELAQLNANRLDSLFRQNAASQQEYDNALNTLISAQASLTQLEKQIEQSRASLNTERTNLEFTRIFAPVAGTVIDIAMNEGRTLNAAQQAPTILTIADLNTMTVETEISEADISKVKKGMDVYFTTLGSGNRRWTSKLRQILPTPTVQNNVVLYTGLFDISNDDGALMPEMTTQVYFVSSSAQNVLTVPMGALTFIDRPATDAPGAGGNGMAMPAGEGGAQGMPDMAAMRERMAANGGQMPEITPEMRERFQQMRQAGNFPGAASAANTGGPGFGASRMTRPGERSMARVTVVQDDGTEVSRDVVIGLTSRVKAEVISGLRAGEQVVAGIAQTAPQPSESNNTSFRRPPGMMFR